MRHAHCAPRSTPSCWPAGCSWAEEPRSRGTSSPPSGTTSSRSPCLYLLGQLLTWLCFRPGPRPPLDFGSTSSQTSCPGWGDIPGGTTWDPPVAAFTGSQEGFTASPSPRGITHPSREHRLIASDAGAPATSWGCAQGRRCLGLPLCFLADIFWLPCDPPVCLCVSYSLLFSVSLTLGTGDAQQIFVD